MFIINLILSSVHRCVCIMYSCLSQYLNYCKRRDIFTGSYDPNVIPKYLYLNFFMCIYKHIYTIMIIYMRIYIPIYFLYFFFLSFFFYLFILYYIILYKIKEICLFFIFKFFFYVFI